MLIWGRRLLVKFWEKHTDVKSRLQTWFHWVERADFKKPQDIKNLFSTASFLGDNVVIFNIKGNKYRLEVKVYYKSGKVKVNWVGTHAEYNKRKN